MPARKVGIPLLVGEWGIHTGDAHADIYTSQMLDVLAQEGICWTRWILAPGDGFNLLDPIRRRLTPASRLSSWRQGSAP